MESNITIDNEKLKHELGATFNRITDLLYYLQSKLYYLQTHNKNYTKKQEQNINDIATILNCIKEN